MTTATPDLSARFALLIEGLCRVVAAHIAADRTAAAWIVLVWSRLRRIARRVERLAAQARAGTVPKLGARFTLSKPRKPAARPPIVLAGKPGWLIHAILQASAYAEYLRQVLDDPEMAALLTAAPQLARVLRPLCRSLGVAPPPRPDLPDPASAAPAGLIADSPLTPPERASRPHPAFARPEPVSHGSARGGPATVGPLLRPA